MRSSVAGKLAAEQTLLEMKTTHIHAVVCFCKFLLAFLPLLDLNSSNWWNGLDLSNHLVWEK
jgi:hypothetical protein